MKTSFHLPRNTRPAAHRAQHGAAVVELAIVLVLMSLLSAGIFEFSRAFWYYNALDKATRDAARYVSALPATDLSTSSNVTAITTNAKTLVMTAVNGSNVSPALTSSNVSVSWDCTPPCAGITKPTWVQVSITGYNITIGSTLPLIGMGSGTVTLQPFTQMRYMN
ncbi:MAG: TadE/TadG family type IV pilus assembly protein [Pseudomonadota bacterium]